MLEGAIDAKCRGEICRSTEGGSVVADEATAVDMLSRGPGGGPLVGVRQQRRWWDGSGLEV